MALGHYKVGQTIPVLYKSKNTQSGLTVITMDVYDEAQALSTSLIMSEIASSGRYRSTFTPDAEGDWSVEIYNATDGSGRVIRQFDIQGYNLNGIGDAIATLPLISDIDDAIGDDTAMLG